MLEDILRGIRKYYYAMPSSLQKMIGFGYVLLPDSIRLGSSFKSFSNFLKESEFWSRAELEEYQYEQLKQTLKVAYEDIPFYQKRFAEYGVDLSSFQSLKDIHRFPTMTKKDLKDNYKDLINPNISKGKYLVTTTGGSTAEPARFLHVKGLTRSKERAFIFDGWKREGYSYRAKTVQLKGRTVGTPEKKIFWQYEAIQNYLEMDSNYLTKDNIQYYVEAIFKFQPEFMIGYASSLYLLAKYMQEQHIAPPKLKCVFLASENVYSWQRDYLKSFFKCRIFSHYGHSEMLLLGMECEHSHDLHFFPQYGFLEVLDNGERSISPKSGEVGELVGTSFHNDLMPLIRYRTQDLGEWGSQSCKCGRNYPIIKDVEGRMQEFIVTRDNRLISICVMGAAHFDVLDFVYETQYYQDTPGKLIFKVVPKKGFSDDHKNILKKAVQDKTGTQVKVEVIVVDEINRTKNGKHLMIEQKIPLDVLKGSQDLILEETSF